MGIKYGLADNPILTTDYKLLIVGAPPIPFTTVGGLEQEIPKVELPDKTTHSSGRTNPADSEVAVPAHEKVAIAFMDAWFAMGKDPIVPGYKKTGLLTMDSGNGLSTMQLTMIGCWISKEGYPDVAMGEDGEMAVVKYTISYDGLL